MRWSSRSTTRARPFRRRRCRGSSRLSTAPPPAAAAAIVAGATASYMIGRSFLPRLLRTRFGRRIVAPDLRKWGEDLVRRHGFRAILLGRFLVALRGPVYLAIGGSKYPMLRFELINGCVGLIEVAALVGLGYEFGRSAKLAHEVRFLEIAVAAIMAAILIVPPIVKWRLVRRHRRTANA